jgi:Protein of unknown function (DUF3489)
MSKPAKKRSLPPSKTPVSASALSDRRPNNPQAARPNKPSKQSLVIEMLRSSKGASVDAMMKVTGWQRHSVRGFLAGVVRKRLKLKLGSVLINGHRTYRVADPIGRRFRKSRANNRR